MSRRPADQPRLPPPWFVHGFWRAHRALHRWSGGRFLWTPASRRGWGALRLTATGRVSGRDRTVIVGYLDDGPNRIVIAMNGWDEGDPAWWGNLQAHPEATVQAAHEAPYRVRARAAVGEERERLWARWLEVDPSMDAFASARGTTTPVVVLEPLEPDGSDGGLTAPPG